MTEVLCALLLELAIGTSVVAAEARGESYEEQVAIARVIRNRTSEKAGALRVMLAPRQFAKPAPLQVVRWGHLAAYVQGRWGTAPAWSENAVAFCTRKVWPRVRGRWTRDWTPINSGRTAHIFLRRKQP